MPNKDRPIIAITIGDPAGIGPEVVIKALCEKVIYEMCRPLVIGENSALKATAKLVNESIELHPVEKASDTRGEFSIIDVVDMHNLDCSKVKVGRIFQ